MHERGLSGSMTSPPACNLHGTRHIQRPVQPLFLLHIEYRDPHAWSVGCHAIVLHAWEAACPWVHPVEPSGACACAGAPSGLSTAARSCTGAWPGLLSTGATTARSGWVRHVVHGPLWRQPEAEHATTLAEKRSVSGPRNSAHGTACVLAWLAWGTASASIAACTLTLTLTKPRPSPCPAAATAAHRAHGGQRKPWASQHCSKPGVWTSRRGLT